MKAHIAISILNSLLLTTTALTARAAEESIADHTPATTTGVIALGPTDTHFNISTLWEKQFSNDDANQDLMSMAVSAGNIFIGLVYYDAIDVGWSRMRQTKPPSNYKSSVLMLLKLHTLS